MSVTKPHPLERPRTASSLDDARAAVLARLWGALGREPLPDIERRSRHGRELRVHLMDGRAVSGPADAAELFAVPGDGLTIGGWTDPGPLVSALWPAAVQLRAEIDNSVANLAAALAGAPVDEQGERDLVYFEQSIIDGHPIHPLCRTRTGMSPAENRAYAPEFRPTVELGIVDVPADRWMTGGTGMPPRLPIHPWQRDHMLDRFPGLTLRTDTIRVRPLMSLRTVAVDAHTHFKTSVDVQMTSAVRIVSPAAIHNGPVVSALLIDLCRDEPIEVLAETATGAVLTEAGGEPIRSLAVVRRNAPRLGAGEVAMPFAALAARSPATGRPFAAEFLPRPVTDFERLVTLMLPPLLRLLWRGVALEAHGQNLLIVFRDGVPARLAYRDMGGVRIHPGRLRRFAAPPPLNGDLATDDVDELRTKLLAAAVSTVVGQLIATLSRAYGIDPDELWASVAMVIHRTYADLPREARSDAAAILGATLPIKATTAMRLSTRPLEDIWAPIRNPMAGR